MNEDKKTHAIIAINGDNIKYQKILFSSGFEWASGSYKLINFDKDEDIIIFIDMINKTMSWNYYYKNDKYNIEIIDINIINRKNKLKRICG